MLSYGLANGYELPFAYQRTNEWIPSSYYFDYLTVNQKDDFAYHSVISNQAADVHPPLFYLLLHTLSSIFQGSFSKWMGISLNIICYVLIYFVIIKIMKLLTKDRYIAYLTATFWGLSIAALSSVMFVRMYVLLTLWTVLFLYHCLRYMGEKSTHKQTLLFIYLTALAGILTQYYFLIIAFFISACVFFTLLVKKNWLKLRSFVITMVMALSSSWLLFPSIMRHILSSGRGTESFANIQTNTNHILEFWAIINSSIMGGVGAFLVPILLIIAIIKKKYNPIILTTLFLPLIGYVLVIQKIAPYQSDRYIFLIFPLIAIIIFYILSAINKKIMTGIILALTIIGFNTQEINYLNIQKQAIMQPIEKFADNDVLILTDRSWKITNLMPELTTFHEIYPFITSPETLYFPDNKQLTEAGSIVVYLDSTFMDNQEVLHQLATNYSFNHYKIIYKAKDFSAYIFSK